MDLRHLRYFVAVAEELNFTRAARRMGIAQPPLSVQIRQLEEELGAPLFDRSQHKVRLTEIGSDFLKDARSLLARADEAAERARAAAAGRAGLIRIGYLSGALSHGIVKRLRKFGRKHRSAIVQLEAISSAALPLLFTATDYDAVLMHRDEPLPGVAEVILEIASISVAVPPKHRLTVRSAAAPADLIGENLFLTSTENRSVPERRLLRVLIDSGVTFSQRMVTGPDNDRFIPVALGQGVAICSSTERLAADTILLPVEGVEAALETVLAVNPRVTSIGSRALMEFLQE